QDKDLISSEFREDVKVATALLRFLLREGTGDHISDQVIDEIEEAQEYVRDSTVPTKEQRAKFIRAYQNLINTPRYSIKYTNIPPTPFWSASSLWPTSLIIFSVIPAIVGFFLFKWYWPALYALSSAMTIIGFYVFTGVVTDRKLNLIIRFCYFFTGISLVIAILPFCISSLFSAPSYESPIGVMRGCGTKQDDFLPKEVVCDTAPPTTPQPAPAQGSAAPTPPQSAPPRGSAAAYQWVVRIGGAATPLR